LVAVNGTAPLFSISGTPPLSFVDLAAAAALGITAGIGARTFAWLLRRSKRIADSGRSVVRVVSAGGCIAALFAIGRGSPTSRSS
jgi:H+/Cl- antiporter ClcA